MIGTFYRSANPESGPFVSVGDKVTKGQTVAIIEAMTITDEIRKLIIARASSREMGKIAIGQGMRTLRMVALDRVREGVSTLEQVLVLTSAH